MLFVLMVLTAPSLSAQTPTIDLGSEVSTLTRYRVYPHLQRGLEAVESGNEKIALAELEQARRLAPDNPAVAMYLADAYRTFGHLEQARSLLQEQLHTTPGEARLNAAMSALPPPVPVALTPDAAPLSTPVRVADRDSAVIQAAAGFAAWNAGDGVKAERALERAWQLDRNNMIVASQLIYVHQRLANNERARWFAERTIDALDSAKPPKTANGQSLAEQRFAFARLHEDLGRRLTLSFDGFSGSGEAGATSSGAPGRAFRSYAQTEADVRLGRPPIRNGASLSLYARVFADGGDGNLALPTENRTIGAGVRWKPLGNRVLFLMAEGQRHLGGKRGQEPASGDRQDVLLRASASLFNGGKWSDDWHPSGSGWLSRNLYLDTAYYAVSQRFAFTGDYRMSVHRRLTNRQTVEPYARVQVNGFQAEEFQRDLRVGLGARWNLWSGERRYDAFRHKWSAGVEYQRAIDTYLPGRNGVFLSVGVRR